MTTRNMYSIRLDGQAFWCCKHCADIALKADPSAYGAPVEFHGNCELNYEGCEKKN